MCERNINLLPLACVPTRDWAHNLGMCPDLELCGITPNQLSYTSQGNGRLF